MGEYANMAKRSSSKDDVSRFNSELAYQWSGTQISKAVALKTQRLRVQVSPALPKFMASNAKSRAARFSILC